MELLLNAYTLDWLNLIIRFVHVVTGIAWIGASFYFVWLDNHLQTPPQWKTDKGIKGDLWAIHGGGFYEVAKYKLAPDHIPEQLHWFKWEAYSTWLSGFALLVIMYYIGAETYLIDPRVMLLSPTQAVGIGLIFIITTWLMYEFMCETALINKPVLFGAILFIIGIGLSYALAHLFSGRGAFIHFGAIIGTIMAGNVWRGIIPAQKALVEAVKNNQVPDPSWAAKAKARSTFNTYTTLPLVFIMISNHYPVTYNHQYNWLILLAIVVITALARQYFVLKHTGKNKPIVLIGSIILTIILAAVLAPKPATTSSTIISTQQTESPTTAEIGTELLNPDQFKAGSLKVMNIIQTRCSSCHSSTPTDNIFTIAPAGVVFDNLQDVKKWAPRIRARTISSHDMPLMNKTNMTNEERHTLGRWINALQHMKNEG
ncbi:urate hydroxylase PuuD [Flocculibacter collagenilyticus]|uniref:urate hydroxylase PuuD n=1 Tax=Flocculibacter collagenilyticus TaxID=2744479 RepID=UPI0018F32770|nr:urate hydroxylase PuuD [Flocculibacter collagenilyticus]